MSDPELEAIATKVAGEIDLAARAFTNAWVRASLLEDLAEAGKAR